VFTEIGSRINKLRIERKLTLKELSRLTNLSVGFLSQLERGLTTVAIDSLDNISKALGVDINYFFSLPKSQDSIVKKGYERDILLMEKGNFIQYQLSANLSDKVMFPRLVEVYPKRKGETVKPYKHEGEEFIFILEGILTYYRNTDRYELYPGDSVHIYSTESHIWENNTNKMVRLVMVSTPNRFQKKP